MQPGIALFLGNLSLNFKALKARLTQDKTNLRVRISVPLRQNGENSFRKSFLNCANLEPEILKVHDEVFLGHRFRLFVSQTQAFCVPYQTKLAHCKSFCTTSVAKWSPDSTTDKKVAVLSGFFLTWPTFTFLCEKEVVSLLCDSSSLERSFNWSDLFSTLRLPVQLGFLTNS